MVMSDNDDDDADDDDADDDDDSDCPSRLDNGDEHDHAAYGDDAWTRML